MTITTRDLDQVLARMACGDLALTYTFVRLWGRPVADILVRSGVPGPEVDDFVQEVALEVFDHAAEWNPASAVPWLAVEIATRAVLGRHGFDPEPRGTVDLRRCPADERGLHLIDVENFGGGYVGTAATVAGTLDEYQSVAPIGEHDQVVIATDVGLFKDAAFGSTGCRFLAGRGPDGADRALLGAAPAGWVVDRFDTLVIGSGDGIFTELADTARRGGVHVVVVARPESLSRSLEAAASESRPLGRLRGTSPRHLEHVESLAARPADGWHDLTAAAGRAAA